jgi:spore germination protein YaaH
MFTRFDHVVGQMRSTVVSALRWRTRCGARLGRALPLVLAALLGGPGPLALAQTVTGAPVLTAVTLTPATSSTPAELTLTGSNFGASYTTGDGVTIAGFPATVVTWTNTTVTAAIPAAAGPGPVVVETTGGSSNPVPWTGVERGYYLLEPSGKVIAAGTLAFYGDLSTVGAAGPAKALTLTPDGKGYWILTADGRVYGFGDAHLFGSPPAGTTAVTLAGTPDGQGYWILAQDGTVYPFGDAKSFGDIPGTPVVGFAPTPDGQGYWILAQDGTVYPFGDAANFGNAPGAPTAYPDGSVLKQQGSSAVFLVVNGVLRHIPDLVTFQELGLSFASVKTVQSLAGEPLGPPLVAPFVSGTVVQVANPAGEYLDVRGVLRPVTSAVLDAMGLSSAPVATVPTLGPWPVGPALTGPIPFVPTGTLIRVTGTKPVYLAIEGVLHHVTSPAVLVALGDTWRDVHMVPSLPKLPMGAPVSGPVAAYPTGTVLQATGQGAVYYVQHGVLRHIPSAALFHALGYTGADIRHVRSLAGLPVGPDLGSTTLPALPPVATAFQPTPDGKGYWILTANGQVAALGDATAFGSPAAGSTPIGLAATPDGAGYLVYSANGTVQAFGDAVAYHTQAVVPIADITPDAVPTALSTIQSVGWGYFNTNKTSPPSAWWDLQTQYQNLSAIAPDWFGLWTNGQGQPVVANYNPGVWTTQMMSQVVSFAQSHGVAVWPSVGWAAPGNINLLRSAANRASIIQQIVALAESGGYNGMTIDFEGMGGTNATGPGDSTPGYQVFNTFVSQLAAALHAVGKTLMVAVYPASYPETIYDYPALAASADYLNVMMYPEYNSGYPSDQDAYPGPTSGLPWVQSLIQQDLATGVSPSQLILGLAPYGYYWTFTPSGFDANASGYMSDYDQTQLIQQDNLTPIWDPWEDAQVFTAGPPAVAPPAPLTNNLSGAGPSPAVEDLQALLDYILIRYAVQNHQTTEPPYLITDGWYGPATAAAVTQFQQDFQVTGATPGVYDQATAAALKLVISEWNIGETTYWDETPTSIADILAVVNQEHLGGIAPWRLGFETSGYWTAVAQSLTVGHLTNPTSARGAKSSTASPGTR